MLRPGKASFLLFSGFDATEEELDIVSTSIWLFKSNDMDGMSVYKKIYFSATKI